MIILSTRVHKKSIEKTAIFQTRTSGMLSEGTSANAEAVRDHDLPQTGDKGAWLCSVVGIVLVARVTLVLILSSKKNNTVQL